MYPIYLRSLPPLPLWLGLLAQPHLCLTLALTLALTWLMVGAGLWWGGGGAPPEAVVPLQLFAPPLGWLGVPPPPLP